MNATHDSLRVLALEPYYGGSHQAFLDTWVQASRHDWTLVTLPARHWKWRMRGSALWWAEKLADTPAGRFDILFTCDMTSVADLRALVPRSLRALPIVCYFHENQLTYPLSPDDWRDYQYAFTNITSALAADAVWFNSRAHLDAFGAATAELLRQMPESVPAGVGEAMRARAAVQYPAVALSSAGAGRRHRPAGSPLRILWCHRWEFDKNPETFFAVLSRLAQAGAAFEVVLVGEQFRTAPEAFTQGLAELGARVVHAGFVDERSDYEAWLRTSDVVVSTAIQENFGIAVVEAMLAGCVPLLPQRLSYPELLPDWAHASGLYTSADDLLKRLYALCTTERAAWPLDPQVLAAAVAERFEATRQVPRLDDALAAVALRGTHPS